MKKILLAILIFTGIAAAQTDTLRGSVHAPGDTLKCGVHVLTGYRVDTAYVDSGAYSKLWFNAAKDSFFVIPIGNVRIVARAIKTFVVTMVNSSPAGSLSPSTSILDSGVSHSVSYTQPAGPYHRDAFTTSGGVVFNVDSSSFKLTGDGTITAHCTRVQFTVTVSTTGSGTTTPSTGTVDSGATTAINATAAQGWTFAGWSVSGGATLTGSAGTASNGVILTVAGSVTATFIQSTAFTIQILPKDTVNVGDEVYLSASHSYYVPKDSLIATGHYEWNFGDGYPSMTYNGTHQTGIAVVHYFMTPGIDTITLTANIFDWNSDGSVILDTVAKGVVKRPVWVNGVAPISGFSLAHASFFAHSSQPLYASIPAAYRGNSTQLKLTLARQALADTVLFLKTSNLLAEQRIVFDQTNLPANTYTLKLQLLTSGGSQISLWSEKYVKTISGIPTVCIDSNNSFLVNGSYFFPVGNYQTSNYQTGSGTEMNQFYDSNTVNFFPAEGYVDPPHNTVTYSKYVDSANANHGYAFGPMRGSYTKWTDYIGATMWPMNYDPDTMVRYVNAIKSKAGLFGYSWQDEPNMGAWYQHVPAQTMAAWQYQCHINDPNHPVGNMFYLYDWLSYYLINYDASVTANYDFNNLKNDSLFGGHKWSQDIIGGDIYPITYRWHGGLNSVTNGPVWLYLQAIDSFCVRNHNIAPMHLYIETDKQTAGDSSCFVNTNAQVYNLAWASVIRGAKAISWFSDFVASTIKWGAMRRFKTEIVTYTNILNGGYSNKTVTSSATTALNRVDAIVRDHGTSDTTYVFASRVTEPDTCSSGYFAGNAATYTINYKGVEPNKIPCTFTVSGLSGAQYIRVLDSTNRILVGNNGVFIDTFAKNDVHIYAISPPDIHISYVSNPWLTKRIVPASNVATLTNIDSVKATNLPTGISCAKSTGNLTGTPTFTSTGTATITAYGLGSTVVINLPWTVASATQFTVTISTEGSGSTTPSTGVFDSSEVNVLTNTPLAIWAFKSFSVTGGVTLGSSSTINPNTFIVSANGTITALDTVTPHDSVWALQNNPAIDTIRLNNAIFTYAQNFTKPISCYYANFITRDTMTVSKPIYIGDSLIYNVYSKVGTLSGGAIIPLVYPPYKLTIKQHGSKNVIPVKVKGNINYNTWVKY